jgi:lipoprotein NlpD
LQRKATQKFTQQNTDSRFRLPVFLFLFIALVMLNACGSLVHHRVERGDTLYSIGWRYNQDYRQIARWNNLSSPYILKEGQWLRVAPPDEPWWADEYPDRVKKSTTARRSSAKPNTVAKASPGTSSKKSYAHTKRLDLGKPIPVKNWQWPTDRKLKAQYSRKPQFSKGVVIPGKRGQSVLAAADGEVVYSGSGLIGYGKLIIVKHNKTYLSAYANNGEMLVGEGDHVKVGQKIATMGSTGIDQVLLYFEIRENGEPVDPLKYLAETTR